MIVPENGDARPVPNTLPANHDSTDLREIDYDDLVSKSYNEENLLVDLNHWALERKFKFIISEGIKETKIGFKRVLRCSDKQCNYRLILKSEDSQTNFKLYEKLSRKYKKHSNFLFV